MPIAQPGCDGARNRPFSGTGWSVDGDDERGHERWQNIMRICLDREAFKSRRHKEHEELTYSVPIVLRGLRAFVIDKRSN
jgi:hypothetical protein